MKNILAILLTSILSACATGPDQFVQSMTGEFDLNSYSAADLENLETKIKSAFIYTLLANTQELRIHQFNGAFDNEVYVKNDMVNGGYPEMVVKFEKDASGNKIDGTGKHVTDCENKGSFNYKHPQREPLGHFAQDILPWMKWGNCREDSTSLEQRVAAYTDDIEIALERLVSEHSSYFLPEGFSFEKSGQAETLGFFFKALEYSEFDLYDFALRDKSSKEKREAFYKALELGINSLMAGKV